MSKVSVIVPVYNAEKTLEKCLNSIVRQTYSDIEIILVNDGSRDSSQTICESYVEKFPNIILVNQKNSGPSKARNTGIDNATGKYVFFVDSDDYIELTTIQEMVEKAEEHDAEMVICGFCNEYNGEIKQHKFKYEPGLYMDDACYKIAVELISDVSSKRIPPYSPIRMIKRDVFERFNLRYPETIKRSEDYYLFVQMHFLIRRLYLHTDRMLYHYVDFSQSVTHSYIKGYWESVKEIYLGLLKSLPDMPNIKHRLNIMLLQRSMIAFNVVTRCGNKKCFQREMKEILSDKLLKNAVNKISFRDGVNQIGMYYILMKLHAYFVIYLKYKRRFDKNETK